MSIDVRNLYFTYQREPNNGAYTLEDVQCTIPAGSFVGLCGHTGSGKSTLVQLLAGLLEPTRGQIVVDGIDLSKKTKEARSKKRSVGLVFQYPEHQLFEETVAKDIAFGPKNLGLDASSCQERVREAMARVGLDYTLYKDRSPFALSGGQKRRVAIAGVLAMQPTYLILDEPTAGLDPQGRKEILDEIAYLQKEGLGVVLVSHSMDDVAHYAERIFVMDRGRLLLEGTPHDVFAERALLERVGLGVPQTVKLLQMLKEKGLDVPTDVLSVEETKDAILRGLAKKVGCDA